MVTLDDIAICISNGPNSYKITEVFLQSYCEHLNELTKNLNIYIHCDGPDNKNDYLITDIVEMCKLINKKYKTNIKCTKVKESKNHGTSLDDFMNTTIKENNYKWVVFLHSDMLVHGENWFDEMRDLIMKEDYSLICKVLNPTIRTNQMSEHSNTYLQSTIYTAFFAVCVKDFFEVNGTFQGSYIGRNNNTDWNYRYQVDFPNNYIGLDTGSMLLFLFLVNHKYIYYYNFKENKHIEHIFSRYKNPTETEELKKNTKFFRKLKEEFND